MLHEVNQSTLVLEDLQQRLMPSIFENERVIKEAVRLAKVARILEIPIIGTETRLWPSWHSSLTFTPTRSRIGSANCSNALARSSAAPPQRRRSPQPV